jgi:hypothetical protein
VILDALAARAGRLTAAVIALHATLVLRFLPPRTIASADPILETDYAHHYDSVATAVAAWHQIGRHWAYDPSFCAGYPAGTIFDVDVKLIEVLAYLASLAGAPLPAAFNAIVLAYFLAAPVVIWAAARAFAIPRGTAALATALGVLGWHADRMLVMYNAQGMCSFVLAAHWALLAAGLLDRAMRAPRAASLGAFAAALAIGLHVHILFPLLLCAPALAIFAGRARRLGLRGHAALLLAVLVALAANAWWIRTVARFFALRTLTSFSAPGRWRTAAEALAHLSGEGVVFGVLGALGYWLARGRHPQAARAGLASLPWFYFLSDLSAGVPVLGTLESQRFRIALSLFGIFGIALGAAELSDARWRRLLAPARLVVAAPLLLAALAAIAALGWAFFPVAPRLHRFRSGRAEYAPLTRWVEQHTSREARVAVMDRSPSFFSPARLKHYVERDYIGGPFSQMNMVHNYASFNQVRFFRTRLDELTEEEVGGWAEAYNVRWIIGGSTAGCERLGQLTGMLAPRARLDLREAAKDVQWGLFPRDARYTVCAFEVRRASTWFLEGSGEVEAGLDHIRVRGASPGRVAIKFHWLEGMRTTPPLPLRRREVPRSPVGFIEVENGEVRDFVIENARR